MKARLRTLTPLLAAVVSMALVAGCGDDDDGPESAAGADANELLERTFSPDNAIESGRLDVVARLDISGSPEYDGQFALKLEGPFQSQGESFPKFDIHASVEGAGQTFEGGGTSTGDKGFLNLRGTDYAISDQVFRALVASYEEAQKQGQQSTSFTALGLDPRRWLTDPRIAGEAEVGDAETIKITGGVDMNRLLDDVNVAIERLRALGLEGSDELEKLSDEQKRELADAVSNVAVEVYTGKDDSVLRRLVVKLDFETEEASGKVELDAQVFDVNEDQEIEAPENAKPFDELLTVFGDLGLGLQGIASDEGGGPVPGAENLDEYTDCVADAGSDVQKVGECAELLSP